MFEDYRTRLERKGRYLSDALRYNSEAVTNAVWMQTVSYRPVIVKHIDSGIPIFDEDEDELLDAHFEQKSKYNMKTDEVTYYLSFRPHIHKRYPEIDIGSYVSIPNDDGDREIWLIVHCDVDEESRKYQILKTNHILKWIYEGKIYQSLVCLRNANSYSSGIFEMDRTTKVEDINSIVCPTNNDISLIGYDQKFIISDGNRPVPICWIASKFQTIAPKGITTIGISQVPFDPEHDNKELELANYYGLSTTPVSAYATPSEVNFAITYSGTKPTVKVGGSGKLFTAQLPANNLFDILWSISDGVSTHTTNSYDNTTVTYGDYTVTTTDRTLQLKVARNYNLVGTVLTIKAHCANGSEDTVSVEVIA